MEFIVEDGTNVPNANSLVSVGESDSFMFFDPFRGLTWTGLTLEMKQKLLVTATAFLEMNFEFAGNRTYPTQTLSWPRVRVFSRETGMYLPDNLIPLQVRKAIVEIALWINERQSAIAGSTSGDGIQSVSTEDLEVTFDITSRNDAIPSNISRLLTGFAFYRSGEVTHIKIRKA